MAAVTQREAEEWAAMVTQGLGVTLTSEQHLALDRWLVRQLMGGIITLPTGDQVPWGPRWWRIEGWAKPTTTGSLSRKLRVRMYCIRCDDELLMAGEKRTLIWFNATRWKRLK